MGPIIYGENDTEVFLGRSVTTHKNVSEATLEKIDNTVRKILETQYKLVRQLLSDNREKVDMMAKMLLDIETIDTKDIDIIMGSNNKAPSPHLEQETLL